MNQATSNSSSSSGPVWDNMFEITDNDFAPIPVDAMGPGDSATSKSLTLEESSVGRPYSHGHIIFKPDELRKAGYLDKWTIRDPKQQLSEDLKADAALLEWAAFTQAGGSLPTSTYGSHTAPSMTRSSSGEQSAPLQSASPTVDQSMSAVPSAVSSAKRARKEAKHTRVYIACEHCRSQRRKCAGGGEGKKCTRCTQKGLCCKFVKIVKE